MSTKPLPLKTIKQLIQAQYCYIVILQAALRDIAELPQEPYQQALSLAAEQFKTLVIIHESRTNEAKTKTFIDKMALAVTPVTPVESISV